MALQIIVDEWLLVDTCTRVINNNTNEKLKFFSGCILL